MTDVAVVLATVGLATLSIARWHARKEAVALAAVVVLLVWGQARGFFPADEAFLSVSAPVLIILLSIGIFAEVFGESGVFERVCRRLAIRVGGRRGALVSVFLVLTYVSSCLLPNLTCLYVLLPVMVGSMRAVGMEPRELRTTLVAIVISSNLGGASTMIGDFPNILISRSQGIPFLAFLAWMLPGCLVNLGVLALLVRKRDRADAPPVEQALLVAMLEQQAERLPVDRRLLAPASVAFVLMLGGLVASGWWTFPPELIVLSCACLCIWALPRPQDWVTRVDLKSTMFIACLFVFAGAIQATGALDTAAASVIRLTRGNPYTLSAAVIGLACVLTAVFSAGPTTAALIPAAEALRGQLPGHLIWWCLSFGVLAGSSASLLSATAGPIAANILRSRAGIDLTFGDFLRLGWKAAALFSLCAIGYVWLRLRAGF